MSEPVTVICVPWADVKVEGSTKVICHTCEEVCGISPATKEGAGEDPIIICMICFFLLKLKETPTFAEVSPKQLEEIKKQIEKGLT